MRTFSAIHATCVTEMISQTRCCIWCRTSGKSSLNSFSPVSKDEILGDVWQWTVIAVVKKKSTLVFQVLRNDRCKSVKNHMTCGFCIGIVIAVYFFNEPIWIAFSNSRQCYLNMGCMFFDYTVHILFYFYLFIILCVCVCACARARMCVNCTFTTEH
jgi:hypothetical protein